MEKIHFTQEMVGAMFAEMDDALTNDPWLCVQVIRDSCTGIFASIRALADNVVEAEDWALEMYDERTIGYDE